MSSPSVFLFFFNIAIIVLEIVGWFLIFSMILNSKLFLFHLPWYLIHNWRRSDLSGFPMLFRGIEPKLFQPEFELCYIILLRHIFFLSHCLKYCLKTYCMEIDLKSPGLLMIEMKENFIAHCEKSSLCMF